MEKYVVLDFETASSCDLKAAGAWRYAEDPTTEILCLAYQEAGREAGVWFPGDAPLAPLIQLWLDEDFAFIAHNAAFEKAIWRRVMVPHFHWPDVPNARWHDTMAAAAYRALPLALERALTALRVPAKKDMEGRRLTLGLSKPRKDGSYERSEAALARVGAYCIDDVLAEAALAQRLGPLPDAEQQVWLLDQRINERGIRLDLPYIRACQDVVRRASEPLEAEFRGVTGGLKVTQAQALLGWANARGAGLPNLQKDTLDAYFLAEEGISAEEYSDIETSAPLPPEVARALRIRRVLGSASVKKLPAMDACICEDGRARGATQYHGAHSGRWAGRLFQPQNFPRGVIAGGDPDEVVHAITHGDLDFMASVWGSPIDVVVSGLRHAIVAAPGRILQAGDFSGIEARVVLALAGQDDKLALLAQGVDVYLDMAQVIYQKALTKKANPRERQVGKATVLGCGFQMAHRTFITHAAKAGVSLEEAEARAIIEAYRYKWAPKVRQLWYDLEGASTDCVARRRATESHGCTFALEDEWLTIRIPSGRKLHYYAPRVERVQTPWDPDQLRLSWSFEGVKTGQWKRIQAFGGLITENVVQAIARDLMVAAMLRAERNGVPVVLTVHDELVTEPVAARADVKGFEQLMSETPAWAKDMGVPVATEAWVGERYRK